MTIEYQLSTSEIEAVLLYNDLKKREEKYLNSFRYKLIRFLKRLVNKNV